MNCSFQFAARSRLVPFFFALVPLQPKLGPSGPAMGRGRRDGQTDRATRVRSKVPTKYIQFDPSTYNFDPSTFEKTNSDIVSFYIERILSVVTNLSVPIMFIHIAIDPLFFALHGDKF